jgi:transposase
MAMVIHGLDDLVDVSHTFRIVMARVEKLDLSQFHEPNNAGAGRAGRDAADPRLLVALWLYVCIRGIGSARELTRRCEDSAVFRWLCGGVMVNHRLLPDFPADHGGALDEPFTQVITSLVDKDVVRVSRAIQEGLRVRLSAGESIFTGKSGYNKTRVAVPRKHHAQRLSPQEKAASHTLC